MKIILAPDSFKGSLSALSAALAMREGVLRAAPDAETIILPMADGGDGTVAAIYAALGGTLVRKEVCGPLHNPVPAEFLILPDGETAVIEMAAASGLLLVENHLLDPGRACTYGTGQLMQIALDKGCTRLILGIGGSATTDGGSGMARALGVRFFDSAGLELPPGGLALARLARVCMRGLDPRLQHCEVIIACDVDNPLAGTEGAARVYGPQKGASPAMVEELDQALVHYAEIVEAQTGGSYAGIPGAGAAGGLGFGLMAFAGGRLSSGFTAVAGLLRLGRRIPCADLVLTGEGRMDSQTARGKVVMGVAGLAAEAGVPVIVLAGSLSEDVIDSGVPGISAAFSIQRGVTTLAEAMNSASRNLTYTTEQVVRTYLLRT